MDWRNTPLNPLDADNTSSSRFDRDRQYAAEYREWVESLPPEDRAKLKAEGLDEPCIDNYTTTDRVVFDDQFATISADLSVGYAKNDTAIVLREIWTSEDCLIVLPACLRELGSPLYRTFESEGLPAREIISEFRERATPELEVVLRSILEAIQEDVLPAAALAVMLKAYGDEDLGGKSDVAIGAIVGESKSNINQVRNRMSYRLGIVIFAGKSQEMRERHRVSNQPKFKN